MARRKNGPSREFISAILIILGIAIILMPLIVAYIIGAALILKGLFDLAEQW